MLKTRANTSPAGRRENRRTMSSCPCPFRKDPALGIQEGQLESEPLSREGLLRPTTSMTRRASTPANQTRRPQPRKCRVSRAAPSRAVKHAPGTHPPSFHSITPSSYRRGAVSFRSEAHREGIGGAKALRKASGRGHLLAVTPPSRAFSCPTQSSTLNTRPRLQNTILARPIFVRRHSAAVTRLSAK